jgi:hypothetical protein
MHNMAAAAIDDRLQETRGGLEFFRRDIAERANAGDMAGELFHALMAFAPALIVIAPGE